MCAAKRLQTPQNNALMPNTIAITKKKQATTHERKLILVCGCRFILPIPHVRTAHIHFIIFRYSSLLSLARSVSRAPFRAPALLHRQSFASYILWFCCSWNVFS